MPNKGSAKSVIRGLTGESWSVVTPSDTLDLPDGPCSALWVNVGGNVHGLSTNGDEGTFTVSAGSVPLGFKRVYSTGTTATGIYAIY